MSEATARVAALGADRFLAEVRITARLDHPHILTLIDSGNLDGTLFYVMPFVRGESLRARLARGISVSRRRSPSRDKLRRRPTTPTARVNFLK